MKSYIPKHWLTTDTHFNHKMLVEQQFRPLDFQDRIIDNWQKLIKEEDIVFHLGDVILGANGTLQSILDKLPGKKILIRGNHDHESDAWYVRNGFYYVAQGILHGGVWLSHYPSYQLPEGAVLNVHGHLHDRIVSGLPSHCKLLSLENTNYKPVEFNDFVGFSPMRRLLLGEKVGESLEGF